MPNGRPGDHPLTDLLAHGLHPFPPDVEDILLRLVQIDGRHLLNDLSDAMWLDLESNRNVEPHRKQLQELLIQHRS